MVLKQAQIFNSGYTLEQLSASSIKHTADELEAMGTTYKLSRKTILNIVGVVKLGSRKKGLDDLGVGLG